MQHREKKDLAKERESAIYGCVSLREGRVEVKPCNKYVLLLTILLLQCGMTERLWRPWECEESQRALVEESEPLAGQVITEFLRMLIKSQWVIKRPWENWKTPWVLLEATRMFTENCWFIYWSFNFCALSSPHQLWQRMAWALVCLIIQLRKIR